MYHFTGAHVDALFGIAVNAPDSAVNFFSYKPFLFFFCLLSVGSKTKYYSNVFILHPCLFQFLHYAGNHDPGRCRTGDVAGHDDHFFTRFYDFRKSGGPYGMSQCPSDLCRLRFHRRTLLRIQFHRMMAVIHMKGT